ncbi:peptidogalycan biosysnthesis protein, partial [Roseomonas sp. DSM 102946]|nr:peptidogalycan biosysnthesis protein [Roseomonas sp. DSM 102946]
MPECAPELTLTLHPRIAEISAAEWDACAGEGNPFVSHAFLSALEDSGSAGGRTGWLPQHAALRDAGGTLLAVAPAYAKSHSYGEYVFDWGWARGFEQAGGRYYPKLQVSVPFSPVPGPRLLTRPGGGVPVAALAQGLRQAVADLGLSSCHVTFCTGAEWE